jgi:hypothetical protein
LVSSFLSEARITDAFAEQATPRQDRMPEAFKATHVDPYVVDSRR